MWSLDTDRLCFWADGLVADLSASESWHLLFATGESFSLSTGEREWPALGAAIVPPETAFSLAPRGSIFGLALSKHSRWAAPLAERLGNIGPYPLHREDYAPYAKRLIRHARDNHSAQISAEQLGELTWGLTGQAPRSLSTADAGFRYWLHALRARLEAPPSPEAAADELQLSPAEFDEHFAACVGQAFGDYLRGLALKRVWEDQQAGADVPQAIRLAGFAGPKAFRRAFQARTGYAYGWFRD